MLMHTQLNVVFTTHMGPEVNEDSIIHHLLQSLQRVHTSHAPHPNHPLPSSTQNVKQETMACRVYMHS